MRGGKGSQVDKKVLMPRELWELAYPMFGCRGKRTRDQLLLEEEAANNWPWRPLLVCLVSAASAAVVMVGGMQAGCRWHRWPSAGEDNNARCARYRRGACWV